MKILFIGHYAQISGFGIASQNYLLAMDSVGLNVVPRPVLLNGPTGNVPDRIRELEQKSNQGCDICIQHVLPHFLVYSSHFRKNIALTILESHNIELNPWYDQYHLMDELWAPCREIIERNRWKKPIHLVPHAFDLEEYNKEYKGLDIRQARQNYKFYYIGEHSKRKNLEALIQAFQLAFTPSDPVSLILKVSIPGLNEDQTVKEMSNFCESVKQGMRLYENPYGYKTESILGTYLSREQILRLHSECDCCVSSSYGEAWAQQLFDSVAMGNISISPNYGGPKEFLHPDFLVEGQEVPCFGYNSFPGINTARERWYEVSILDLAGKMRECYEMKEKDKIRYKNWYKKKVQEFSYKNIGKIMKGLLK